MNVTDVALRVPSSRETRSAAGRHLVTPGGRFAAGRDCDASVLPVSQPVKQSSSQSEFTPLLCLSCLGQSSCHKASTNPSWLFRLLFCFFLKDFII